MMFEGVYTALVTPFKDGKLDLNAMLALGERQVNAGISGLVLTGTTGEAATLTYEEKKELYSAFSSEFKNKITLIAGTGSNNTSDSIICSKLALECGMDGLLIVTPYYNKPSQAGLYNHYKEISQNVDLPIIVYNVPGRTGVNILPETVKRLSEIKDIVAVKEAGTFGQMNDMIMINGEKLSILSGDDFTFMPFMALGGNGVISVISNLVPEKMIALYKAVKSGDLETARKIHYDLYPLSEMLFIESNPTPAKAALSLMGLMNDEVRIPLSKPTEKSYKIIEEVLKQKGLI